MCLHGVEKKIIIIIIIMIVIIIIIVIFIKIGFQETVQESVDSILWLRRETSDRPLRTRQA
jgi:cell division protein FtsL